MRPVPPIHSSNTPEHRAEGRGGAGSGSGPLKHSAAEGAADSHPDMVRSEQGQPVCRTLPSTEEGGRRRRWSGAWNTWAEKGQHNRLFEIGPGQAGRHRTNGGHFLGG